MSQLKGGPFGEKKTNFRKMSHNAEKLKGGPFGVFQYPFRRKTSKIEGENFYFRKKKSQCQKIEKGDPGPFGIFQHPFCRKTSKKMQGDPLGKNVRKKCFAVPKKIERGDPLGFFNIHAVAKHQKNAGGPFGEKCPKKCLNAEKLKGGPFGVFQYPFCRKTSKIEGENFYFRKSRSAKKLKRGTLDPLGFFNIHFVAKHQKNAGDSLGKKFRKKCFAVPKKIERGTLWCCPVWYVTRKNMENLFGPVR